MSLDEKFVEMLGVLIVLYIGYVILAKLSESMVLEVGNIIVGLFVVIAFFGFYKLVTK